MIGFPLPSIVSAGLAVLAGALIALPARADESPGPQAQTMQQLVRLPIADLNALFAAAPTAVAAPSGYLPGRAIKNPGSRRTAANSRITHLVWQGKYFHDDGTMTNRLFGFARGIPADVYVGESRFDGRPALIFNYSRSRLWPAVHDEVREVSPGLYLGIMYKHGVPADPPMYFALDARK
jgi:hypothetical protein